MMKYLFSACLLVSTLGVYAYTSDDVIMANRLADADLIVPHKNDPDAYRLDVPVARQEVIGMTLKLKGIALPLRYDCQGYFSDATFSSSHTDAWVCRAVELAADRGLITRENTTTRPRDTITRAEALAMIWKGSGMETTVSDAGDGTFYDRETPANTWQENLLQSARKIGMITPTSQDGRWFWRHDTPATRKEIFALLDTFQTIKDAGKQMPYLTFSGEAQYTPGKTQLLSTDPALIREIKAKNFSTVISLLKPTPLQTRREGSALFVLQETPDRWGDATFSSIAVLRGMIIQQYSTYNPYSEAISAMLQRFHLGSEAEFYALPYGLLWEQTRDYVELYFMDLLGRGKIVYPEGSPIVP